jgi:hypothetical protein
VCIPIHPDGKHFEGQQTRLPPCHGLYTLFITQMSISFNRGEKKSADQSRSVYSSFLQYLGSQYSPEKIKGKRTSLNL